MRLFVLAAAFAAAAACSKKSETAVDALTPEAASEQTAVASAAPADDPWPEGFPKPSADYAGVFEIAGDGKMSEVRLAASGGKQRMAYPPGSDFGGQPSEWSRVLVTSGSNAEMVMWSEGENAPKVAATLGRGDLGAAARAFGVDPAFEASAKKTGADEVAGEKCAVWEITADGAPASSACVTRDGIVLRAISGGETVMLAKSIERGAQDASLFAPPAGYELVDMGECMRMGAEMMAAMQSGQQPQIDEAKMQRCQAAGEKLGAMSGPQP